MKRNFDIVFTAEQKPYFQVNEAKKVYIPFKFLEQKPLLAKDIVSVLFNRSSKIDASFLNSYIPCGQKKARYFHKIALHKAIDIRNWKMYNFLKEDFGDILRYVTIEDIKSQEVYRYILSLLKGKKDLYIGFYNDDYFMQVDRDEMIIIAKSEELLTPINELIAK